MNESDITALAGVLQVQAEIQAVVVEVEGMKVDNAMCVRRDEGEAWPCRLFIESAQQIQALSRKFDKWL